MSVSTIDKYSDGKGGNIDRFWKQSEPGPLEVVKSGIATRQTTTRI